MEPDRLLASFIREAEDLLEALDQGLLELESGSTDSDLVDRLFRAAHTLKGNAGMVGFSDAVQLTHVLENVLDRLRSRNLSPNEVVVGALFAGVDVLRGMTELFCANEEVEKDASYDKALAQLAELSGQKEEDFVEQEKLLDVQFYLQNDAFAYEELSNLVDELGILGELSKVRTLFDRVGTLDEQVTANCRLGMRLQLRTTASPMAVMGVCFLSVNEEDLLITDITADPKVFCLDDAAEKKTAERTAPGASEPTRRRATARAAKAPEKAPRKAAAASTLRVETEKLDRLVDLVGEVLLGISQVREPADGAEKLDSSAVERLEVLGRDLQEQVMTLRMVPVQETFERFRRPIRDLSKELDKPVSFEIRGGSTQVDKRIVESLVDPLKHMLRNSVSHGLESGEERVALGKPETGSIVLNASQREGAIVLEIQDDGRGIDSARVRAKAEQNGWISPDQELSETQLNELIFMPGFSTAAEVSEISGRGVGMDVVRRSIQSLRGSVEIDTELGKGTTFRIRLPLTLAIVDGMNVMVGGQNITIPLRSVLELIAPDDHTVQQTEGKHEYIDVRGELLPIVRLEKVLHLSGDPVADTDKRIVVVETERRKFGLMVDHVFGMSQAVIKPLDRSYRLVERMEADFLKPRSIGGAAILGNGKVGIILDVHGIDSVAFEAA